jgi:hypothetical protein
MQNVKLTFLVALAFALGATTASASSVNVIWQVSGTAESWAPTSASVTADIVLRIGTTDSQLGGGGGGAVIELSADRMHAIAITGHSQTTLSGWINLGPFPPADPHSENVVSQSDLLGYGLIVAPGQSVIIGTITVHVGWHGKVTVQPSGPGDDIIANSGTGSILGEFVFNPGWIIPEPTTGSLLGLGLVGLAAVGRRRRAA